MKWEPLQDIDRFLDEGYMPLWPRFGADLATDIYEENNAVIAKLSLPGVAPDEVTVELEDNLLTVTGQRAEETKTEDKDYFSKEIKRGSFTRSLRLPRPVDATAATAAFGDGILTVTMPVRKGETNQVTTVPITG